MAQHSDTTYSVVKGLGYDKTNKKLGLVIEEGGADSVIPFSGGHQVAFQMLYASGSAVGMAGGIDFDGTKHLGVNWTLPGITVSGNQSGFSITYTGNPSDTGQIIFGSNVDRTATLVNGTATLSSLYLGGAGNMLAVVLD